MSELIHFVLGVGAEIDAERTYGSGYPGVTGRGVTGRGFPFWFWPMVWGSEAATTQSYLNGSEVSSLTCPNALIL